MKQPAVYLLASGRNGTLHVGATSALVQRIWQHREHLVDGFSKEHEVTRLVWHEMHETMESAIVRGKQIKAWKRAWKIESIGKAKPYWRALRPEISGQLNPEQDTGFLLSQE